VTAPEYTYKLGWNGATSLGATAGTAASGSTYVAANCTTGDWVVGINYAASCLFDYMKVVCAPISYVRSGATWGASTGTTSITNVGGQDFARTPITKTCPAGSVLTELTTWAVSTPAVGGSNYVSGMRLGCKPLGFIPQ
jgi:hypothetical protein